MSKHVFLLFSLLVYSAQPIPRLKGITPSAMPTEELLSRLEQGTTNPDDHFEATTDLFKYVISKQEFVHLGRLSSLTEQHKIDLIKKINEEGCGFCSFYVQQEIKGIPERIGAIILGSTCPKVAQDLVYQAATGRFNE